MTTIPDAAIEEIVRDCSVEHEHPDYGHGLFATDLDVIVSRIREHLTPAPQAEGDVREAVARVLDEADDHFQHGVGSGGYDPDGLPLWLADAVLSSGLVVPVGEATRLRAEAWHLVVNANAQRSPYSKARDAILALDPERLDGRDVSRALSHLHSAVVDLYMAAFRQIIPTEDTAPAPSSIPARLLSGEHVGREVVLPDGTRGRLMAVPNEVRVRVVDGRWAEPKTLAPDDVVTLVDETEADHG